MTKISQQNQRNNSNLGNGINNSAIKVKRTRKTVPRDSPPQRSSIYRGVTRHRWTGRYEAHLWDKNCWNESQNKKGRQVYLGAYDDEEAAAHAYDLAALKYWGQDTTLNFPLATYQKELKEMEGQSREEYIGSLRRKSSGFSRGVSKYRGVARHHHNGRWEARIGRVFGNKYLYLGTYATQEEAAIAYDMAAIEYRGLNAVTNFDLSRYIKWLRPNATNSTTTSAAIAEPNPNVDTNFMPTPDQMLASSSIYHPQTEQQPQPLDITTDITLNQSRPASATSALGLLLQSSKFKEMMEMTLAAECPVALTTPESEPTQCSIPDDAQSFFTTPDMGSYIDQSQEDIFSELINPFMQPMLQFDFDV
ncbi:AP2-like ethylene-responsive transcription factor At1g79700 [Coffea arabica]|uniref:AP2-like ethylene-responsive transcription factor At1g79700 n=1 Tax=Coffea arabica TaxID=13443 RepID=A0A6P6SGE7_COFAR|nr:AP2-like ethylene-responsive transcription factor At1g79700 [Coffea arabica]